MSENLKHGRALLQGIVDGVRQLEVEAKRRSADVKLGPLEVVFISGAERFEFGLVEALDALANDTYWDDRGNWSEADRVEVRVI